MCMTVHAYTYVYLICIFIRMYVYIHIHIMIFKPSTFVSKVQLPTCHRCPGAGAAANGAVGGASRRLAPGGAAAGDDAGDGADGHGEVAGGRCRSL